MVFAVAQTAATDGRGGVAFHCAGGRIGPALVSDQSKYSDGIDGAGFAAGAVDADEFHVAADGAIRAVVQAVQSEGRRAAADGNSSGLGEDRRQAARASAVLGVAAGAWRGACGNAGADVDWIAVDVRPAERTAVRATVAHQAPGCDAQRCRSGDVSDRSQ